MIVINVLLVVAALAGAWQVFVKAGRPNIFDIIKHGKINFVINTPRGEKALHDEEAIGAASVLSNVPFVTTIEAAEASVQAIDCIRHQEFGVKSLQEYASYRNK